MFKNISLEQALSLIKQDSSIIIIDIRDKEDFQKRTDLFSSWRRKKLDERLRYCSTYEKGIFHKVN